MYCLFNGKYGEHDLSNIGGIESIVKNQQEQYSKYKGMIIGDFTVLDVEYDWGKRDQRWHIQCNLCGEKTYLYHAKDWRRGKGRSTKCRCRKIEKEKKKKQPPIDYEHHPIIGEVVNGVRVIKYVDKNQYSTECVKCGKHKLYSCVAVLKGNIELCNHRVVNDYSDPKWIGARIGNLTTISYEGRMFRAKCDCGNIVSVRGVDLFRRCTVTSCRSKKCPYSQPISDAAKRRDKGLEYEHKLVEFYKSVGLNVERTPDIGDYGVDFIIYHESRKIAVQCKKQKSPANVNTVQEVYAGGRYYDCNSFMVISPSGFTLNSIKLASKIGVVLTQNEFSFSDFDNIEKHCAKLVQTMPKIKINRNYERETWEIDGVKKSADEWCREYSVSKTTVKNRISGGLSVKEALNIKRTPVYTAFGITGTVAELSKRFDILPATVNYRLKYRGMTIEEALTAPKNQLQ